MKIHFLNFSNTKGDIYGRVQKIDRLLCWKTDDCRSPKVIMVWLSNFPQVNSWLGLSWENPSEFDYILPQQYEMTERENRFSASLEMRHFSILIQSAELFTCGNLHLPSLLLIRIIFSCCPPSWLCIYFNSECTTWIIACWWKGVSNFISATLSGVFEVFLITTWRLVYVSFQICLLSISEMMHLSVNLINMYWLKLRWTRAVENCISGKANTLVVAFQFMLSRLPVANLLC